MIYWICECVPLAVTAFFPIFLFPLLLILDVKKTCANYLKDTNFLFFGGLVVALAVEESNLHTRIALRVLLLMGSQPRWLMLGFMIVTAFLSMWISNTATTAMMVPIAVAVLDNLNAQCIEQETATRSTQLANNEEQESGDELIHKSSRLSFSLNPIHETPFMVVEEDKGTKGVDVGTQYGEETSASPSPPPTPKRTEAAADFSKLPKKQRNICKAILLSICYAANIGGTGTLTGTGPNLVLRGQLDSMYPHGGTGVSFASWLPFAIPAMIGCLILAWIWLQLAFFGLDTFCKCNTQSSARVQKILRQKYKALGPFSFAEGSTACWFIVLVVLWIFREPRFIAGWADDYPKSFISDASPAMLIACILFAWPNQWPDFICCRESDRPGEPRRGLVTWAAMQKRFPWAVIMLLGGGFALADGVKASGLSIWIGCLIQRLVQGASTFVIISVFTIIVTFITEVTSNTATASIFIPIVLSIAENLHMNPLLFALPITIAPSFAFMLPVATPPNAIVYETGAIRIIDMVWVGFVQNWLCIGVTLLNTFTWASFLFSLDQYPSWGLASQGFNATNCTI